MTNGLVALALIVLVGVFLYTLIPQPTPVVKRQIAAAPIQPSTPVFYAGTNPYGNWDLWPIPMFPNSMPWGGRH